MEVFYDIHEMYVVLNGSRSKIKNLVIAFKELAPPRMENQEKCSVWTSCRGRTCMRLSKHHLDVLLSEVHAYGLDLLS